MTDMMPRLSVGCDACGATWTIPGRWAVVVLKLAHRGRLHLFSGCPKCGSIIYAPGLDILTGEIEFFFRLVSPLHGVEPQLQRVTYDVGQWRALAEGGSDSPESVVVTPGGRHVRELPGRELVGQTGICAAPGVLPFMDVKAAITAVSILYP